MKSRVRGIALLLIGGLLLLIAGGWLLMNLQEDQAAGEAAERYLQKLQPAEQQLMQAEGALFCTTLSIERLDLELPIFQQYSEAHLKEAPCRWSGSLQTQDLIIAGHNYTKHFGRLHRMRAGDEVVLTDGLGAKHTFIVKEKTTLDGTAVEDMKAGDWDLTLFTCTKGRKQRVTLRCVKK